jgi:hypothetical protein
MDPFAPDLPTGSGKRINGDFRAKISYSAKTPADKSSVNEKDIERVRSFGAGLLKILEYRLGNLKTGEQAKFEFMRFEVELSWPAEFAPSE